MSHTPGPWKVCDIPPPKSDPLCQAGCQWVQTDRPFSTGPDPYVRFVAISATADGMNGGSVKANARLIAAAPDLLAALIEMTEDIGDRFDMRHPSTNPGIKHCFANAVAAIAKATGSEAANGE